MSEIRHPEDAARAAGLLAAQKKALALFAMIERELVRPGISEAALSEEIYRLAADRFGVTSHWHRRIVRAGPHTLLSYAENPPDRVIEADDIVFIDLGPVFQFGEADFARTFVLGTDPHKHRLRDALEPVFRSVQAAFDASPEITGEELYACACRAAERAGWTFGGAIAGHLVGVIPQDPVPRERLASYIAAGRKARLRDRDAEGRQRHWVLEIHLVDRERQIGGFYEQLLTAR